MDIRYGTSEKSNSISKGMPVLRIPNVVGGKINLSDLRHIVGDAEELERYQLKNDDILLVRTNANPDYIGRCALFKNLPGTLLFASYLIRIRVDSSLAMPEFVARYLQSQKIRRRFRALAHTSAGNYNINIKDVSELPILLPSLREQEEIERCLQLVDASMKVPTEAWVKLEILKKGLMQRLLTRGIGHTRFKQTMIGEIPESWGVVKLGDPSITTIVGGTTPSRDNSSYWNGTIPWATPTDVTALQNFEINQTKDRITEKGMKESSVKLLPVGSVLMTSRATIGFCAINTVPITTNQGFASFICTKKMHNKFLLYLLSSIRAKLERYASGSTFKEISKATLRSSRIQLPPIEEQKRIAAILEKLDNQMLLEKELESRLNQLKKGLMQVLLTGKVRVKV